MPGWRFASLGSILYHADRECGEGSAMRQLIAGNWKMHGLTEQAATIAGPLRRAAHTLPCDLLVCPPATMVLTVAHILVGSPVAVGGQDCHAKASGAHTGDVSAAM